MATKYATIKDSNGDTIYPQISTDSITNGSITSDKMAFTTSTVNCTFGINGVYTAGTMTEISLGGKMVILVGHNQGNGTNIQANTTVDLEVRTGTTPYMNKIYGYAVNALQIGQPPSYMTYSVVNANYPLLVDSYVRAVAAGNGFYISYIIFGEKN